MNDEEATNDFIFKHQTVHFELYGKQLHNTDTASQNMIPLN